MRTLLILLTLLLTLPPVHAQEAKDTLHFVVMSWNVENLFDLEHDTLKNDQEFLPTGSHRWNSRRYWKKLDHIAKCIVAVGQWELPALVGMCEVENDSVLRDLTRYSALQQAGYRYLVTHSPDERGIDVALLYQRHLFKPIARQDHRVSKPYPTARPTRDILHVSGKLLNGDTLDVLVAHFPSRSSGVKETRPYRLLAAQRVKEACDSVCRERQRPQIILMGDFNDYPHDRSVREVLKAEAPPAEAASLTPHSLYHLLARRAATDKEFGSYKYRGEWGLIDHLIVSGKLLRPDAPMHTSEADAGVFRSPFLLTDDPNNGGQQPFRTYLGTRYLGGFSDHLPLYALFHLIY